jgi:hypothetical protein
MMISEVRRLVGVETLNRGKKHKKKLERMGENGKKQTFDFQQ